MLALFSGFFSYSKTRRTPRGTWSNWSVAEKLQLVTSRNAWIMLILKEWSPIVVFSQYYEINLLSEIPLFMWKMQCGMVLWWHEILFGEEVVREVQQTWCSFLSQTLMANAGIINTVCPPNFSTFLLFLVNPLECFTMHYGIVLFVCLFLCFLCVLVVVQCLSIVQQ